MKPYPATGTAPLPNSKTKDTKSKSCVIAIYCQSAIPQSNLRQLVLVHMSITSNRLMA
jgi:hypothetical protein